jgi:hypothetical protein
MAPDLVIQFITNLFIAALFITDLAVTLQLNQGLAGHLCRLF